MINVARDARIAKMGQPLLRMSWMRAVCFWESWRTHCQAVQLKSFKIKTILLNFSISVHVGTQSHSLSLSLILSGDFLQLFKLQTTWTRRTLNLTKKLRIRGGNKEQERSKEGSKAFILLTRPQIKMKEKRCVQISSKNLPWDPLFQQSPEV